MKFTLNDTIGDIATAFPKAMDLFVTYNIDFCCGGNRPIGQAIEEQQLDGEKIIQALNQTYEDYLEAKEKDIDFGAYQSEALIQHIICTHHDYLREELPKISQLTKKIWVVHGDKHPKVLEALDITFHHLKEELESHLIKEEEILFPMVLQYEKEEDPKEKEKMAETIQELEEEHEAAGDLLKKLRQITEDFKVPGDVCNTYAFTYEKLHELELDMFKHIHLENNILFKRIK